MKTELKIMNGYVLLERYDKAKKKGDNSPFTSMLTSNNLGIVKYSGIVDITVGTQVYFAGQFESMVVDGFELLAMKQDNIIGVVCAKD